MTTEDYAEIIEKKVLRHLAIKAGRNQRYFVSPTLDGLKRATWCEDEELISCLIAKLVQKGQITPASQTVEGKKVCGFVCLPAKFRNTEPRAISAGLKLTPFDLEFLKGCGIAPEAEDWELSELVTG